MCILNRVLGKKFHAKISKLLPRSGYLIFEAFAKEQKNRTFGGPKEEALFYDAPSICNDFQDLHILPSGKKKWICRKAGSIKEGHLFYG